MTGIVGGYDGKRAKRGSPLSERIALHTLETPGGCWRWTAALDDSGYGRMQVGGRAGRLMYAHRVSYQEFVGAIPEGMQIDHLCRVRACVNPKHLDVVTPRINTLRGQSVGAQALRRENCLYGHPYSDHGITSGGRRICRVCRDAYRALWAATPYEVAMRRKREGLPVVDLAAYFAEENVA